MRQYLRNAKVGPGQQSESCTGHYGLGNRNQRGDMLVEFAERHSLKIVNTLFKKRPSRRWTWISPNSETKNEIDYILTDKPRIFTDLSIVNKFNTGSDHRMVRGKARINTKLERAKMIMRPRKINTDKLRQHQVEFEEELKKRLLESDTIQNDNLDATAESTAKLIHETALHVAGKHKKTKPDKLSATTKMLREKRRDMKRGGTARDNIEYVQICKAIRQGMKNDIKEYNEREISNAIEKNKSVKQTRRKQCLGKSQLFSIMEEDGTTIHNKDRIITRCVEFYQELYRSRIVPAQNVEPQQLFRTTVVDTLPEILPEEVEVSLKRLDRNKAPGDDNITGGMLLDGGATIVSLLTKLYNQCLQLRQVPKTWQNAVMVLLHKKGNTSDIKNYRPISLLPIIYKVFSHILLKRILNTRLSPTS